MKFAILGVLLVSSGAFAQSNDLVLVDAASSKGTTIALDLLNDGKTAAAQFVIDVGTSDKSQVDLSNCLTEVRQMGRSAGCSHVGTKVIGLFVSPDATAVTKRSFSLGTIVINSPAAKSTVEMWETYDAVGKELSSKVNRATGSSSTKG